MFARKDGKTEFDKIGTEVNISAFEMAFRVYWYKASYSQLYE